MSRSRLITRCARIFLLILAADVLAGTFFLSVRTIPFDVRVLDFWKSPRQPRILILGSSRPRENIDSAYLTQRLRELGYPHQAFNLAFSGGGAIKVGMMFERVIRPKLVGEPDPLEQIFLIDVGDFELHRQFYNEGVRHQIENAAGWAERYPLLQGAGLVKDTLRHGLGTYQTAYIDWLLNPIYDVSGLYRFWGDWSQKEEARKAARRLVFGILPRKNPDGEFLQPLPQIQEYLNPYDVGETQTASLSNLIHGIRKIGARPLLVTIPMAAWGRETADPSMKQKFHAAVQAVSKQNRLAWPSITNEQIGFDDTYYFDDLHLKRQNRRQMTEALLQRVILPALKSTGS
ncbi:hypothetical protein HY522_11780 [bacterium]|nr:hypothetical protein [bacterium]